MNSNENDVNKNNLDYRYVTNLYKEQNNEDKTLMIKELNNQDNLGQRYVNSQKELNNENKVNLNELRYSKLKTYTVNPPSSKSYSKRTEKSKVDQLGKLKNN